VRRDLLRKNLLEMGHRVEKMRRVKLASLEVDTVPEGHYRRLDPAEVAKLAHAVDYALTHRKPAPSTPKEKSSRRGRPK
jgi:16S rRNA U516 pseudouridylate synthase RsuA-like enzyme